MENLKITNKEIYWERVKHKRGSVIKYTNQISRIDDNITVVRITYVNGIFKSDEVCYIPVELLDKVTRLI